MAAIPGPYEVFAPGEGDNDSENYEIHDGYGRTATVYGELDRETWDTANLLAQAPRMLELLRIASRINRRDAPLIARQGWRKEYDKLLEDLGRCPHGYFYSGAGACSVCRV